MPGFYIIEYIDKEFDSVPFKDAKGQEIAVEGRYYYIDHLIKPGAKAPSDVQIIRNFTNAFQKIGGKVIYQSAGDLYMKIEKGGGVTWAHITSTGKAAVYGIYFDTGKSAVKPESEPALTEIGKLMTENASLKLHVVGHTDNVGDFASNMKLSQARAEAVVQALVTKYGVDAKRLKPAGVGPLCPAASNSTDEGKAKNRRVELVEQ